MSNCTWRDKPGALELCDKIASAGREFCPRHEFMDRQRQEQAEAKHRKAVLEGRITTPMPKTRRELLQYGYQFCDSDDCRGCGKHIEFWRTPNGNRAPYDPMAGVDSRAVSHFATCTHASSFRRHA